MTSLERGTDFHHEALFYSDRDEFLAGTVPFVREGLDGDEAVLIVAERSKVELLEGELGGETELLRFADMEEVGRNPARIIPAWRDFVDQQAHVGRGIRGVGEPVWPGRDSAALDECKRHELLLNVAFAAPPAWSLLCPYDSGALEDDVLVSARRSHAHLVVDGASGPSPDWSTEALAESPFGGRLPAAPAGLRALEFGRDQLGEVRGHVAHRALEASLSAARMADLVASVNELATNSVVHGGGRGSLRVWREPGELLVEVRDSGRIKEALVGRVRPPITQEHGRGLWLTNQLCDLVQIRSGAEGTAVRVRMARD